jgi:hypothetical protein
MNTQIFTRKALEKRRRVVCEGNEIKRFSFSGKAIVALGASFFMVKADIVSFRAFHFFLPEFPCFDHSAFARNADHVIVISTRIG